MITKKYYKLIRVSHADSGYFYIKNVSNEVGEFKINSGPQGTIEYSLDGTTWTSYDLSTNPTVNVNPNSNIYLRGTGFKYVYSDGCFSFNKNYNIGGNFMGLINYATMSSETNLYEGNSITYAFKNQTNLISAEDLNFGSLTNVGRECLKGLFNGCTSLTTGPYFSGITTLGYSSLYATFENCSSLTVAPDFSNISTITTSSLSATFNRCTSLTTGPDFSGITNMTGAYNLSQCFFGCTHISNVTTPNVQDFTQNNVLSQWLDNAGTQATGTKVVNVPTGATIATNSTSGIPTGWTRVDY